MHAIKSAHDQLPHELSHLSDEVKLRSHPEQDWHTSLHDPALQKALTEAEDVLNDDLANTSQTSFLPTLHFDRIHDRYDTVAEAYGSTFEWTVHFDSRSDVQWHNFASWIESNHTDQKIYWIAGQPGSGKSTLMKYLASSATIRRLFKQWAGTREIVLAQCYFWAPGTDLQKSLEGMLRTLITQLLEHDLTPASIVKSIYPVRWHQAYDSPNSHRPPTHWSLPELKRMFRLTLEHLMQHRNVVLFVDGLDEYGKNTTQRQELVDLFLALETLPRLKLCLSSRPWNVFSDAFKNYPCLRLEDLNRPDIMAYITSKCDKSPAFQELVAIRPERAELLKRQIVDQSSGVFLWVTLVVKRLLLEMQDGPGLLHAEEILAEMPRGLDEYFNFMLERIRPEDQVQVSRIYQIMISAPSRDILGTLMLLSFTDAKSDSFADWDDPPSEDAVHMRLLSMKRFFKSQSMDLLVWHPTEIGPMIWMNYRVGFLHRTVIEYLHAETVQAKLQEFTGGSFDTCWYSVNALMVALSATRPHTTETDRDGYARETRTSWFKNILLAISNVDSKHLATGYSYLTQAADDVLNTIASRDIKLVATRVDDVKLLLAMFCGLPKYFLWYVDSRGRPLPRDYCLQYLGATESGFEISGRPEPRMLAAILRHTERSRVDENTHGLFRIRGLLSGSDKAGVFGLVFAKAMRNMTFSSTKERKKFSTFVEYILLEVCSNDRETVRKHLTDAQKTWTVISKWPWAFGGKRVLPKRST